MTSVGFLIKSGRIWLLISLGIGLGGAIFFFPMNIDSRYTCLYHRMFHSRDGQACGDCNVTEGGMTGGVHPGRNPGFPGIPNGQAEGISRANKTGTGGMAHAGMQQMDVQTSQLLEQYIHGYALFWWGSILLLAGGYFLLRKRRSNQYANPNPDNSVAGQSLH